MHTHFQRKDAKYMTGLNLAVLQGDFFPLQKEYSWVNSRHGKDRQTERENESRFDLMTVGGLRHGGECKPLPSHYFAHIPAIVSMFQSL